MAHFEVVEVTATDCSVVVEANHWTEALLSALDALGEPPSLIDRMTVDRDPDTGAVQITASPSERRFDIVPCADVGANLAPAAQKAAPPPAPAAAPAKPAPPPAPAAPAGKLPATADPVAAVAARLEPTSETSRRTKGGGTITLGMSVAALQRENTGRIVRGVAEPAQPGRPRPHAKTVSDSAIEAVFLRLPAALGDISDALVAAERVVDLMVKLFPAEGHAVLFFDDLDHVFRFASARGPSAKKVLRTTVPSGAGIVGFALRVDTTVRVDDAVADPRFFGGVDAATGASTRAVLCAPISYKGRTWGCIEAINPTETATFSDDDAHALGYLGRAFGEWIDALPADQ